MEGTQTQLVPYVDELRIVAETDNDPDLSYLEQDYADVPADEAARYRQQDAERLASYGETWHTVGVYAEARLKFRTPQGGWTQGAIVRTPGIWGIETDSELSYFDELGDDQLAELQEMLGALGMTDELKLADARRVDR